MKKDNTILPVEFQSQLEELLESSSIKAINDAFQHKANLLVEEALLAQDELYSEKLIQLINAIDKDHTKKLKRVVEAVDKSNAKKLINIVNKYEKVINSDAKEFKKTLVESISDYIEEYIDEAIPTESILEATKNRTALEVLNNLRNVLAVDSALMKESVKEAVQDGKTQLNQLTVKVKELEANNKLLAEKYTKAQAALLLESKTAGLSTKKKEYLCKLLGDKTPEFIKENFDYTLRLIDKKEKEKVEVLKEEAFVNRKVKADAPRALNTEKKPEEINPYVSELKRMR